MQKCITRSGPALDRILLAPPVGHVVGPAVRRGVVREKRIDVTIQIPLYPDGREGLNVRFSFA